MIHVQVKLIINALIYQKYNVICVFYIYSLILQAILQEVTDSDNFSTLFEQHNCFRKYSMQQRNPKTYVPYSLTHLTDNLLDLSDEIFRLGLLSLYIR